MRVFTLLLLSFLFLSHCGLVEDALPDVTFNVTADQLRFELPATAEPANIESTLDDVPSEIIAELNREDIDTDRIKSVKIEALELELLSVAEEFSFTDLNDLTVTVVAPGLRPTTLAAGALRDVNGNLATLDVADTDLAEQLLAERASYTVSLRTSRAVPEGVVLGVTPVFAVVARPL